MNADWMDWLALAGLAAAGLALGAYESALQSLSRSRLSGLLEARGAGGVAADAADGEAGDPAIPAPLRRLAEGDRPSQLSAAMLRDIATAGLLLYGDGLVLNPPGNGHPIDGFSSERLAWLLLLIALLVVLRAVSVLAGGIAPERLVLRIWRPVWLLVLPLRPLARLFLRLEALAARGLGLEWDDEEERREDKLKAAVSDGALDGVVEEGQRDMIAGVVDMKDDDVADIFTPRTRMVAVPVSATLDEAIRAGLDSGYSRLPVYSETRDHIVGVFYLRDALEHWNRPEGERPVLEKLLRKTLFVPETKKASELLRELQREKIHLAVVLDEYGGTAGIVTIEDVLEEIVGEIRDEYDHEDDRAPVRAAGPGAFTAEGAAHVADVNQAFGSDLLPEDDDYETVAGFVLDQLGHIPATGESFVYGTEDGDARLEVKILNADERRVGRVALRRLPAE